MNVSSMSHKLVSFDRFAERVPFVSTVTSLLNIFQKCVLHFIKPESIKHNHYFTCVKDKSFKRCVVLLVPVLGNIAIKLYDIYNDKKANETYTEALKYYNGSKTPDLQRAYRLLKEASERGHLNARHELGLCYFEGYGVTKDRSIAFNHFLKGAFAGNKDSITYLGISYENGFGTKIDLKRALKLYQQTADSKHVLALYRLAACYQNGIGTKVDEVRAADLYKQASDKNFPEATNSLAMCYEDGKGVNQNYGEAYRLYKKASDQGHISAMNNLGICLLKGYGTKPNFNEAAELFETASKAGNASATYNLATCFYNGKGKIQCYQEAFKLLKTLENSDLKDAYFLLGECYSEGNGVDQSHDQAFKWFNKASAREHPKGIFEYGRCLLNGIGTEKDPKAAIPLLVKAQKMGIAESSYLLGKCHENGTGVIADKTKAFSFYEEGAAQNHTESTYNFALCLLEGTGTASNQKKGFKLIKSLADEGHLEATYRHALCLKNKIGTKASDGPSAFKGFLKAAKEGHVISMRIVGESFLNGQDTEQSETEAAFWFNEAAKNNDLTSIFQLGKCHYYSIGIPQNQEKALRCFETVEKLNSCPDVQFHLGLCHLNGFGTPLDEKKALQYFEIASTKSHSGACYHLATFYLEGKASLLTREQSYKKAKDLLQESVNGQYQPAYRELGSLLIDGRLGSKDYKAAIPYFLKGVEEANDAKAMFELAKCYQEGLGVKKSNETALEYYEMAALNNHPEALVVLAESYQAGSAMTQVPNIQLAEKYYEQAALANSSKAKIALASFYIQGSAGTFNKDEAIKLLEDAVEKEPQNHKAHATLGLIYYNEAMSLDHENDKIQNFLKARNHFQLASNLGNTLAMVYYGELLSTEQIGLDVSFDKAFALFNKALNAPQNFTDNYCKINSQAVANYQLGRCYQYAIGAPSDTELAFKYYQEAKNLNELRAYFPLGYCHFSGFGTVKNPSAASGIWDEGAKLNDPRCIKAKQMFNEQVERLNQGLGKLGSPSLNSRPQNILSITDF